MLSKDEINFISQNSGKDCKSILLKKDKFKNIDINLCVNCIEARAKIKNKVPGWYNFLELVYPLPLSIEQCSSQASALYKSSLLLDMFKSSSTKVNQRPNIADLTGGLGIDSYFMALQANKVYYFERNPLLSNAARYNFKILGINNIEVNEHCAEGLNINSISPDVLDMLSGKNIDFIYLDPARRASNLSKLIKLEDYEPNVLEIKDRLLQIAKYLIIKVSPMADIRLYLSLLAYTESVHIVSVDNECKELLFILSRDKKEARVEHKHIMITAANISLNKQGNVEEINKPFVFSFEQEESATVQLTNIAGKYIYEPNKSILKGSAFRLLSEKFNLSKFDKDTHIYTSDNWISFPGKVYRLIESLEFNKRNIKTLAKEYPLASLTARNLPIDTDEFRRLSGIKEGGEYHIFAFGSIGAKRLILVCKREFTCL